MKDYLIKLIREKGLRLSLLFTAIIICANVVLVIYYRNVVITSSEIRQQIQDVRDGINNMSSNVWFGDLGVRAYLIKQTDQLLNPYIQARDNYSDNLNELENNLKEIGFDIEPMESTRIVISDYMQTLQMMVDLCNNGRVDEALEIFYEDRGFTARQQYGPFIESVNNYIDELNIKSEDNYKNSINLILFIQIILILILLPILFIVYRKLFQDSQFRAEIFKLIKNSSKEYLYDDGNEEEDKNEDDIIKQLVDDLKKAVNFINSITQGNYDIEWEGLSGNKIERNKNSIAGELTMMRDQMLKAKKLDEIRIWINEGLSKFADLIRKHQHNLDTLSEVLVSDIVKYLGAQQGGLFFVYEDEQKKQYLKLMGCYAYQRKKFVDKRIEIGQGMIGQCFLEGETTHITNIPEEYVHITSGLGDTKPTTLLIVPLKMNEEVVGVIEIASLKPFEKSYIEFLERLADTIAASITSIKVNESTKFLLEQSQQQAEEMRAQEEEMRQNMEELQATQEQMHRKNDEVESLLKQSSENEESMRLQMKTLSELQNELAKSNEEIKREAADYKNMLMDILNEIPQKVFLKDADGKMYIANQKVADVHGLQLSDLIGKSDYDFVDKETADAWRKQELEIMEKGEEKYVFEDTIGGKKTILESIKKVINIRPLKQIGLLGIQTDITEKVQLENELKLLKKN